MWVFNTNSVGFLVLETEGDCIPCTSLFFSPYKGGCKEEADGVGLHQLLLVCWVVRKGLCNE